MRNGSITLNWKQNYKAWSGSTSVSHPKEILGHPIKKQGHGMYFWDSQCVIMTNSLPRGSSVTGPYYANKYTSCIQHWGASDEESCDMGCSCCTITHLLTPPVLRCLLWSVTTSTLLARYMHHPTSNCYQMLKEHLHSKQFSSDNDVILCSICIPVWYW